MFDRSLLTLTRPAIRILPAGLWLPAVVEAQTRPPAGDSAGTVSMADHAMSGPMDTIMMRHMDLTPPRVPTHADSVRATQVAAELKEEIVTYQDTAAAVADGYKMFAPSIKNQRVTDLATVWGDEHGKENSDHTHHP